MPVISAWSYAGATSTMSAPTTSRPASPRSTSSSCGARQPACLRRTRAGGVGRVEHVDVDADVDRPVAQPRAHPLDDVVDRGADEVTAVDRREAEPLRLVEVQARVERAAEPDVHRVLGVDQPLLGGAAERRPVRVRRTEVGVPRVEVGVEVQHRDRAVPLVLHPKQRQGDRVVPAERQQRPRRAGQLPGGCLDLLDRLGDRERVHAGVTGVGDLCPQEGLHLLRRVVGAEQPRRLADVARPEPRTWPVGDPAVEGHPQTAMSASGTSVSRGSRAKVASPA